MAVRITTDSGFRAGVAQRLFSVVARAGQFEPSRDGQRFLVNVGSGNARCRLPSPWTGVE